MMPPRLSIYIASFPETHMKRLKQRSKAKDHFVRILKSSSVVKDKNVTKTAVTIKINPSYQTSL